MVLLWVLINKQQTVRQCERLATSQIYPIYSEDRKQENANNHIFIFFKKSFNLPFVRMSDDISTKLGIKK